MKKQSKCFKVICFLMTVLFANSVIVQAASLNLPSPGQFVPLSKTYSYPVLKGLKIDPNDPFKFEFIIDTKGKKDVSDEEVKTLTEYFLAVVTTPSKDLWVNLSPYEKDRVISDNLSDTELGKGLLSQDYILKQLLASVTHPESKTGKDYWNKAYKEIAKIAKNTNIPVDTFNKIWITPKTAKVIENNNIAFITEASLKAMLEEDFNLQASGSRLQAGEKRTEGQEEIINKTASDVMKQVILPEIEKDINYGENFAKLRQIYNSFILGVWFKKKLKDSIFQHYINQNKTQGIDLEDKTIKDKVYNLYTQAYKQGLYDYVKKENQPLSNRTTKRRYFSGGIGLMENAVGIEQVGFGVLSSAIRIGMGLFTFEHLPDTASSGINNSASSGIGMSLDNNLFIDNSLKVKVVEAEPVGKGTPAKADDSIDKGFVFDWGNVIGCISESEFFEDESGHQIEGGLEFIHYLSKPEESATFYLAQYNIDKESRKLTPLPYLKVSVNNGKLEVERLQSYLQGRHEESSNSYKLTSPSIVVKLHENQLSFKRRLFVGASNISVSTPYFILKSGSASSAISNIEATLVNIDNFSYNQSRNIEIPERTKRALIEKSEVTAMKQVVRIGGQVYRLIVMKDSIITFLPKGVLSWCYLDRDNGRVLAVLDQRLVNNIYDVTRKSLLDKASFAPFVGRNEIEDMIVEQGINAIRWQAILSEQPGAMTSGEIKRAAHVLSSQQGRLSFIKNNNEDEPQLIYPYDLYMSYLMAHSQDNAWLQRVRAEQDSQRVFHHDIAYKYLGEDKLDVIRQYEQRFRQRLASSSIANGGINLKEAEDLVEVKGQGVYYNIPAQIAEQFGDLGGLKVTAVSPGQGLKSMLGLEN